MTELITPERLASSGTEIGHQKALFCWARNPRIQSQYPDLYWLFAIPNGAIRHKAVALELKASGVKRGVSDMCLLVRRGNYPCLWIELKLPKRSDGRAATNANPEQNAFGLHAKSQGHAWAVAKGWEAARDIIIQYLEWKD